MEPGHEDREYVRQDCLDAALVEASMEPGHEDREYRPPRSAGRRHPHASMEPGHEDREYARVAGWSRPASSSLNGARS